MRARVDLDVSHTRTELVAAHLHVLGAVGVWERPGVLVAWFDDVPESVRSEPAWRVAGLPDELRPDLLRWGDGADWERDWQAEWKATVGPVRAGRFVVVPSWLAESHRPADDERTLVLDPGRSFGSGHHATTILCLELLDELDLAGVDLLDVGCGTGILAIAAATRGARVRAVDIDPEAVEMTLANAAANGVHVDAEVGTATRLGRPATVVVANLVTDTVVAAAGELVGATSRTLVVSGITAEREDRALRALTAVGARVREIRRREGWIAARLGVGEGTGPVTDPGVADGAGPVTDR